MIPMNPMQIIQAVQRGANPNQLVMQIAQQNPAMRQALQAINGKTPQQIEQMAMQMAKQRGVDLNAMLQQWGITQPRM